MAHLGPHLRETLRNLETLRDRHYPPPAELVHLIDTLYEQLITLIDAAIDRKTGEYAAAAAAMAEAASKTEAAINGLARTEEGLGKVTVAIDKVAALLARVAAL